MSVARINHLSGKKKTLSPYRSRPRAPRRGSRRCAWLSRRRSVGSGGGLEWGRKSIEKGVREREASEGKKKEKRSDVACVVNSFSLVPRLCPAATCRHHEPAPAAEPRRERRRILDGGALGGPGCRGAAGERATTMRVSSTSKMMMTSSASSKKERTSSRPSRSRPGAATALRPPLASSQRCESLLKRGGDRGRGRDS